MRLGTPGTAYTPFSFSAPFNSTSMSTSPFPSDLRTSPCSSGPRTAATAVLRRGGREVPLVLAVTSPDETAKTVCRLLLVFSGYGVLAEAEAWGGGTEKRARSCGSVSLIKRVMSVVLRRALVKIFGGGKLRGVRWDCGRVGEIGLYGRVAIDSEERAICSR